MASIIATLTNLCAAQNHGVLTFTVDKNYSINFAVSDFKGPITDEDIIAYLRVRLAIARLDGVTNAQILTALKAGYEIAQ